MADDATATESRPGSKRQGLMVIGQLPPTRSSAANVPRTSTSSLRQSTGTIRSQPGTARSAKTAPSAMDILVQQVIKNMRAKLGNEAFDVKSQEAIASEVQLFMTKAGTIKDEDMPILETRIRARMSGESPLLSTLSVDKRSLVFNDDWAKIYKYDAYMSQLEERRQKQLEFEKRRQLKDALELQLQEREMEKLREIKEKQLIGESEEMQYQAWVAEEEERHRLQNAILERLRQERNEQLHEKHARIETARQRQRQHEERMMSKLAQQAKRDFEKEEAHRQATKQAVKELLMQNEEHKAIKKQAMMKALEEDKKYMELYDEMLHKLEVQRMEHLEKTKRVQAAQQAMAAKLPSNRRWISESLIERYGRDSEEAKMKDEERRREAIREKERANFKILQDQIEERHRKRVEEINREHEEAQREVERLKALAQKYDEEMKITKTLKKSAIRQSLEDQMKDSARRRKYIPMTDLEKRINRDLVERAVVFEQSGRLVTPLGSRTVSSFG